MVAAAGVGQTNNSSGGWRHGDWDSRRRVAIVCCLLDLRSAWVTRRRDMPGAFWAACSRVHIGRDLLDTGSFGSFLFFLS